MSNGQLQTRAEVIESKIDKVAAGKLSVSSRSGGMEFRNMEEVLEFSKLMSISGQAVPPHCRNQPGVCLGITIQAIEWRMSPFAVANKSYVVNDRLSYEAQLIHAVIEQRAPLARRLRHEFSGVGASRRCKVIGHIRGENEPLEYLSPEIASINPKNSPLWKSKPDLQLYYNTVRDWARTYYPDVIMGVYSDDEMVDSVQVVASERPAVTVAASSSLDALADRLEAEPSQVIVDEQPEEQDAFVESAPSDLEAYRIRVGEVLAEFDSITDVQIKAEELAAIAKTSEELAIVQEVEAAVLERIRGARGPRAKQQTLA